MESMIFSIVCIAFRALLTMGQISLEEHKENAGTNSLKTILFLNVLCTLAGLLFILHSKLLEPWLLILIYIYSLLIFGILWPAHYAHQQEERIDSMLPAFLKWTKIFSIFTFFIPINPDPVKEKVSEEDIREMINAASESENIDEPQKELIENVFDLDDTSIEEICTHRSQVISLSMDETEEAWRDLIHNNRHTFYPVMKKDNDDVIGVLDTRDYFRLEDTSKENVLNKAVDQPLFLSENSKADDVFSEMKNHKTYFAIVLDEYGGMTGIVTLHDIVETLLGEMYEVDDEIEPEDIVKINDTVWQIYGAATLDDVAKELEIELPLEEYDTFGGYILGSYGHIPNDGTTFDLDLPPLHIQVEEILNHRVGKTIVTKVLEEKEDGDDE